MRASPFIRTPFTSATMAAAVAAAAFVTGCQQVPVKSEPGPARFVGTTVAPSGPAPQAPPDLPVRPEVVTPRPLIDDDDPSWAKLQDIGGLLLGYWASNRRLPAALDDLRSYAGPFEVTDFTCPESKQPFVYLPQAGRALGGTATLVAYAPAVSQDGLRRALFFQTPRGAQPAATKAAKLTEAEFRKQLASVATGSGFTTTTRPAQ